MNWSAEVISGAVWYGVTCYRLCLHASRLADSSALQCDSRVAANLIDIPRNNSREVEEKFPGAETRSLMKKPKSLRTYSVWWRQPMSYTTLSYLACAVTGHYADGRYTEPS